MRALLTAPGLARAVVARYLSTVATVRSEALQRLAAEQPRSFHYDPTISTRGKQALIYAVKTHKPRALIVGADVVDEEVLQEWKAATSEAALVLRRGTSETTINKKAAAALGIVVRNTPQVNSTHVAEFLFPKIAGAENLGLIGFGAINSCLANLFTREKTRSVIASSPALLRATTSREADFRSVDLSRISTGSMREVFTNSDKIVIAINLGTYGDTALVTGDDILSVKPKAQLFCVSEPEVFSDEAFQEIAKRLCAGSLSVHLDNSPANMKNVAALLDRLAKAHDSSVESLQRSGNLTLSSTAMSAQQCQRDMDLAMVAVLLVETLRIELPEILQKMHKQDSVTLANQSAILVGGGISSLLAALDYARNYNAVSLVDNGKDEITNAGPNKRHVTDTETTPHALTNRIDGEDHWRSSTVLDPTIYEAAFQDAFKELARNPALVKCLQKQVVAMNRMSRTSTEFGWRALQERYPEIFDDGAMFGDGEMLRLYGSDKELSAGFAFQSSVHQEGEVQKITGAELSKEFPHLAELIAQGKVVGAVRVPGLGVRVLTLSEKITDFIKRKFGTESVQSGHAEFNNGKVIIDGKEVNNDDQVFVSTGVSPLVPEQKIINRVYGTFIEIPNLEGISQAFKFHAKDPIGVMNISPSEDGKSLYVSGGFQYFGQRTPEESDLENLFNQVESQAKILLPKSYEEALKTEGGVKRKFCPRPMTATGFPIFISHGDNVIVVGGHNAGGTAQSPLMNALAKVRSDVNSGKIQGALAGEAREFIGTVEKLFGEIHSFARAAPSKTPQVQDAQKVAMPVAKMLS